jgi:Ca2+-binding EF-hand superfamily protein
MEEFKSFANELNLNLNKTFSIPELFKSIDKDNSKTIDFEEFIDYYKKFTNGEELKFIFDKYSQYNEFFKENTISPEKLIVFFTEVQKEKIEKIDAKILILLIKKTISQEILAQIKLKLDQKQTLTTEEDKFVHLKLDEFKIMIYDKSISSVYSSTSTEVIQDMNKPLNEYFIFSSHNTYLTGHQVYGGSDPEMYSTALLIGCRLVELDVYNGGPDGPIVKHGFTMTGEILLIDVLENIRKSAFVVSEYPVILSIENKCNEDNQIKMANLFKEILVDLFVVEDETKLIKYPSPYQLRRKFIIKV